MMQIQALPVIDDAGRKILSLIECNSTTTDKSIKGMEEALKYCQIRQCTSNLRTQFIKTEVDKSSRFKQ